MSKIQPIDLSNISDTTEFMRFCSQLTASIVDVINGKIEYDANIQSQSVSVTFTTANVDVGVSQKLNKKAVQYIVTSKSAACDVYNGVGANTTDTLYLRGSAPATVTLELF